MGKYPHSDCSKNSVEHAQRPLRKRRSRAMRSIWEVSARGARGGGDGVGLGGGARLETLWCGKGIPLLPRLLYTIGTYRDIF